jgi:hypothetical protein
MAHKRREILGKARRISSVLLAVAFFCAWSGAALAQCPVGSFPWVDSWGNQICRSFDGGTATIEGSLDNCPTGTHPWVDSWGNRICKSFGMGSQYYDTSGGCPVGTYEWTDSWGNEICKRF